MCNICQPEVACQLGCFDRSWFGLRQLTQYSLATANVNMTGGTNLGGCDDASELLRLIEAVVRVLEQVSNDWGQPVEIVIDNGPGLTSRRLDQWSSERGIQLRFIEPGKPIQNVVMESFNGRLRDNA